MSFIVAAASTAAVSAISAGAITGGVTGAIAAGSIGATLGGVAAGAATAGALGAGIGAIGAAATGGDVGKGALSGAISGAVTGGIAPGLGGATAGLGTVGSGIVTGGIAGAAGSAAGAAAVGEDAGKAALMGGGIGAIGGALGGAAKTDVAGEVTEGVDEAAEGLSVADKVSTVDAIRAGVPDATEAAFSKIPASSASSGLIPPSAVPDGALSTAGKMASDYGNVITNNPIGIAKSALPDLATGAYYGGGLDTQYPTEQPTVTQDIGGAPLADTYQRTGDAERKTLPKHYAAGGGIPRAAEATPLLNESTTPAQPQTMNKFAGMGVEAAKIGDQVYQTQQQQQQPQPQQQQVGIPRPMQPTPPPAPTQLQTPTQQNQPMFYAAGGAVQTPTQGSAQGSFTDQVRALAAQKVKEHYAQQARDLQAQQQAQQQQYAQPRSQVINTSNDGMGNSVSNVQPAYANGGMAQDNLGGYSHGGIAGLTRGPGDGVSDSIPAQIGDSGKQPARLADGEFVVPARIVSELGNGSTEAGAKALQAMVDRIQSRRRKTVGKGKVAVNSRARKELA